MKSLAFVQSCFLQLASASTPVADVAPGPDRALDSYGNICREGEKARLDNFAVELQNNPDALGFVVVYAGGRSCLGEAQARAERAKKWVEGRGVAAGRIVLKDGGYQEKTMTRLSIIPRGLAVKKGHVLPGLERDKVKVYSWCRGKIYEPAKCDAR